MPRPRTFEEERAVEAAMRAFWSRGCGATSTEDLCEATGLARSSIYNTFRSKRDLFERALQRYMDERTADVVEVLGRDLPIRERVRTLMWQAVDPDQSEPVGCLVANAMVEAAPHDPRIAELLRRDRDRRAELLRAAFEAARRDGEIGPDRDPAALARFVLATTSGLYVMASGGAGRDELEAAATVALGAL